VQANCGRRAQLRIAGVEVGRELEAANHPHAALDPKLDREQGSIVITIGTDAPFLPHQLTRLAKRATNGLARTGSINDDLSGDIAIAFSTANRALVPLRGIKDSPPYLHDERLLTLDDTVEFFNIVLETKLTKQQKSDLVAFMRAL
jgi:L-aminopeptidase/D-esterase-like protein